MAVAAFLCILLPGEKDRACNSESGIPPLLWPPHPSCCASSNCGSPTASPLSGALAVVEGASSSSSSPLIDWAIWKSISNTDIAESFLSSYCLAEFSVSNDSLVIAFPSPSLYVFSVIFATRAESDGAVHPPLLNQ